MNSEQKLHDREQKVNSLLCVGLDSDIEKLPERFLAAKFPQFAFNKWIINLTHDYVSSYKPNLAFYEAQGDKGMRELKMTLDFLRKNFPDIFVIADAKRADIGSTNLGYVKAIFDWLGADAVTLHPYLGQEAVQPFLNRKDKVSIVLCRTSNPGASEFQDSVVDGKPFWQRVAERVSQNWNENQNCMLVVGATYPKEMAEIRQVVGDMTFLVPGIGAQGGDVKATVAAGLNSQKSGLIINAARSIIFAENPALAAQTLRDEINQYR